MSFGRSSATGCGSTTRPAACGALLALLLGPGAAYCQLTVGDNLRLREDDFDLVSFAAGNRFGSAVVGCDFDGDGFEDLAIGAPRTDVLGVLTDAGVVHVAYGGLAGLTLAGHQTLTQPLGGSQEPEADDRFGTYLAAGDFDGDGYCDLAAAAYDGQFFYGAGSVHVFPGSEGGLLTDSQVWSQSSPGIQDFEDGDEFFGVRMAAGDFDGDGFDDLAIAAPLENMEGVGMEVHIGVVHVLFGTIEGLTAAGNDLLYQGDPQGSLGTPEAFEQFGGYLAAGRFNDDPYADLVVGIPRQDFAGGENSGAVHVYYGAANGFASRNQLLFDQSFVGLSVEAYDEFGFALAAGDFDGDGLDDLAVGSRGEDVGPPGSEISNTGSVAVLYATPAGLSASGSQIWTQGSGLSDQPEEDDLFGSALTAADFDGDGRADLAVGVPGEDFEGGGRVDNGALHVLYGGEIGLSSLGEQYHGQGGWNLGQAEDGDEFGSVLGAGDFDGDGVFSLVAGTPLEGLSGEAEAGLVGVITGHTGRLFYDGFESGDNAAWSAEVP